MTLEKIYNGQKDKRNLTEKVWYACYGSNLLEERFLCYIQGGQPNGAKTINKGCRDKTLPTDSEDFYICSELYFARNSGNWDNGGVAFIRTTFEPQASTLGRIYLISKEQLLDVAQQETNTETELTIDFDKAISEESFTFKRRSWYGNLLYLGQHNDYPIFTLTNENDLQPLTKPSSNYLITIINGLKETHNFDNNTIFEYLITKKGIADKYTDEELLNIVNNQ